MKKIRTLTALTLAVLLALSAQACSRVPGVRDVSEGLAEYTIRATYAEDGTLSGHLDYEFANRTANTIDAQEFLLYGRAFRKNAHNTPLTQKCFYQGASYGDMSVTAVTVDGAAATPVYKGDDDEILRVEFPEKFPDDKTKIGMDFTVKLARANHRLGITQHTVNLGNFYPTAMIEENGEFCSYPYYANGDPFYTAAANYTVELEVPAGYVAAGSGAATVSANAYSFRTLAQRDFAAVLSKEFKTVSAPVGNTAVTYYYYRDEDAQASLSAACDSLDYFGGYISKYPYDSYQVVQTGFVEGGMEYPGLVMISDATNDTREVIVHETAHQWWYGMVGSDPVRHAWQDEGLTEFMTTLFVDAHSDYGEPRDKRIMKALSAYLTYCDVYDAVNGKVDTSMDRRVNEFKSEYEYTYMTYVKGELLFNEVYTAIGAKKFQKGLQQYFRNNCFKNAAPADMIAAFERAAGRELESFFNSWLNGSVVIAG